MMSYWRSLLLLLLLVAGQQHLANSMEACDVNLFRLPTRFQPFNYNLELWLYPGNNEFYGKVTIDFNVYGMDTVSTLLSRTIGKKLPLLARDPRNIILNAEDLEVGDVKFSQDNLELGWQTMCHDAASKILVVTLDSEPSVGVAAELYFEFKGIVQDEARGLFRSFIDSGEALVTHLKPSYARRVFPCFDEPQFKATFKLTIKHPPKTIALANTPLIGGATLVDDLMTSDFEPTPKMSTYLLGFAVGEFDLRELTSTKYATKIAVYLPKGRADDVSCMLGRAVEAYDKVRGFFADLPQPLRTISIVAVNMEHRAVENWGLITMSHGLLLTPEELLKPDEHIHAVTALTDVMVRFWLGNFVTVYWWDELWFMEGLCNYLTSNLIDELHPEIKSMSFTLIDTTHRVMDYEDLSRMSHPIRGARFKTVDDIENSYNSNTYKKSEAIFRMFTDYIGQKEFNLAILDLVEAGAYHLVTADDWLEVLSRRAPNHDRMKIMFQQWTEQAGYPIITAVQKKSGKLVVTQESSLWDDKIWSVPISYELHRYSNEEGSKDVYFLGGKGPETIDLSSFSLVGFHKPWLKLNVNFQGYYRVIYRSQDNVLNKAIARAVQLGRMTPANRLHLLSDGYALAKRSGLFENFVKLMRSFSNLGELNDEVMLLLTRILTEVHVRYPDLARKDVVKVLMINYHKNKGFSEDAGSNVLNQYARGEVLGYLVGILANQRVIGEAREFMRSTGGRAPPFLEHVLNHLPPEN